ncbi:MAG: IPT/TIG domain-containing protein [Bryobacterales bacterium]|nr:IPT/TIG domain-containing protein [Bryobacterales bacterium]
MLIRTALPLMIAMSGMAWGQTLPTLSLTPSSLSFTYVIGTTALPAAQTVTVKRSGSGAALDFTTTITPASPWLIVTPPTGKTGTAFNVRVNPTSLTAGTYLASIDVDATGSAGVVSATVVLIIKNPPPAMAATPASLAFAWQTDASASPAGQTITVSTDGEPLSFTVAATGGTWLACSPAVGVALAGSPVTIAVTVDTTGMLPGTNTGKITLTSTNASNKSITIGVSLTVNPGTAVLTSVWPNAAPLGSGDTTITIRGSHLFKASVVKANTTDLTATWISTGVVLAVVPKAMLNAQGTLNVTVLNSPQPASNQLPFTITAPGPQLQTIVNAASFAVSGSKPSLAPGEIISIFGSGLGPATAITATPANNAFPATLGTPAATVEFEVNNAWVAAPLIFIQANQINCQVPFTIPVGTDLNMRVSYNNITSSSFKYDGVAADPGLFTVDSSGRGQAAALNYASSTFSLNSANNAVAKGGLLILYLTGGGAINPLPNPEGALSGTSPIPVLVNTPSVTIGGEAASVVSATAVPGALGGLTQLNVTVPSSLKAAKDHAVVVAIAGRSTPATATVAVK